MTFLFRAPEAKPTPEPQQTTTFTSIFDQLKLQQQGKTLGLKSDADGKKREADDDQAGPNKKTKKKKTVRWKTGDELAKIKLIEWMEPEGEYYGGGSGHENHEWGNARNFDVEEGREALAALKNRNLIDEEEDLLDWYQPKGTLELPDYLRRGFDLLTITVDIDFSKFHDLFKNASTEHAIKRGGNKKPTSEEAKIQSQRELVTLSALYTSSQSIPFSPQEPDTSNDGSQEPDKEPVVIPLPDNIKASPNLNHSNSRVRDIGLTFPQPPASLFQAPLPQQQPVVTADLSAILSAFQPQVQQPQQQQPQQLPAVTNDFMASLQAITRQVAAQAQQAQQAPLPPQFAQQPQPQQPVQQNTPDISSILAALGGVNAGQQQTQQQQHASNTFLQNLVQQNPTAQSAALGNALAQLGMPLLASYSQPPPLGYEAPAIQNGWSYESQVQQAYGNNPTNNNANQTGWNGAGGTDEFGRALRDGEKEKEGRSVADIRRETKEKGGVWDERNIEAEQTTGGGRGGGGGGGNTAGGRGGGWGGKHKKVNY